MQLLSLVFVILDYFKLGFTGSNDAVGQILYPCLILSDIHIYHIFATFSQYLKFLNPNIYVREKTAFY